MWKFAAVGMALGVVAIAVAEPAPAPAPTKAPAVSRKAACEARFAATCKLMRRCLPDPADTGGEACEAIEPGCGELTGDAPFTRPQLDACTAAVAAADCSLISKADPSDPSSMDIERSVAACKPLSDAERKR